MIYSIPHSHQAQIDFENEGGETYICGNPPYKGTKNQTKNEKDDLKIVFSSHTKRYGTLDYVAGWFFKATLYTKETKADFAFVSTNSICQGGQVPVLWPLIYSQNLEIKFAYQSFKWRNLASNNAVVTVIIVGLGNRIKRIHEKRGCFKLIKMTKKRRSCQGSSKHKWPLSWFLNTKVIVEKVITTPIVKFIIDVYW
jgi:hypothetical protein